MKINPNFKKVALLAVRRAGRILKDNFRKKIKIRMKVTKTKKVEWVTNVDIACEETIRETIKNNFPDHNILGEEKGGKIGKGFAWVIDPLDGTSNYILGLPFFSVALALLKKQNPILSIVFNPITNELYFAQKGNGAFLNQKRIRVNKVDDLPRVLLSFNKGKDFIGSLKVLTKIAPRIRTVRFFGSDNLEICQVAVGRFEGYFSSKPAYHDSIVGGFIAEEAGGKVTDFAGKKYTPNSTSIIITNGKIHNKILKLINKN